MAEKEVRIRSVAKYNGHSVKPTKVVALSFKFRYDELPNSVQSLQMLNENITIKVKLGDEQAITVGVFMITGLNFNGDGDSILNVGSNLDSIEPTAINDLAAFGKDEIFKVMLEALIITDEKEEDEEEPWDE